MGATTSRSAASTRTLAMRSWTTGPTTTLEADTYKDLSRRVKEDYFNDDVTIPGELDDIGRPVSIGGAEVNDPNEHIEGDDDASMPDLGLESEASDLAESEDEGDYIQKAPHLHRL